jgi:hypothetical protein
LARRGFAGEGGGTEAGAGAFGTAKYLVRRSRNQKRLNRRQQSERRKAEDKTVSGRKMGAEMFCQKNKTFRVGSAEKRRCWRRKCCQERVLKEQSLSGHIIDSIRLSSIKFFLKKVLASFPQMGYKRCRFLIMGGLTPPVSPMAGGF